MADGELLYAYGEWTEDERELLIISEKELLASTWGLVAFAPWLQRAVVSWTERQHRGNGGDAVDGTAFGGDAGDHGVAH